MYEGNLNKRFVVFLALLFFVAGPVLAWVVNPPASTKSRDTNLFYELVDHYNTEFPETPIPGITINSFRHVSDVWYVVEVTSNQTQQKGKLLAADFYNNPDRMEIVSTPFAPALQYNISGIGVPYDLLEELNDKSLLGDSHE